MQHSSSIHKKLLTLDQLTQIRMEIAAQEETLVQCHGCFDIVHPGHIRHLQFAASQGDRLIVSITADAYVNKGPDQPMFTHDLRAENLAALEIVDWVYIHHEPTAVRLLEQLKPDIYIKGAEYAQKNDPRFIDERQIVESYNGRIVFSSADVVYSSTAIVESIQKSSRRFPETTQIAKLGLTYDFSTSNIQRTIKSASQKRVVVVGESIIDTYTKCEWPEIADEHPMLSLRPISTKKYDGGAAVVAKHIAALGAKPFLCTLIPNGTGGDAFVKRMRAGGVEVLPVAIDGVMPEKKRFIVDTDKVMKLDCTSQFELDNRQRNQVVDQLQALGSIDGLLITDFGLGMFNKGLAAQINESLQSGVGFIAGDVSGVRSGLLSIHGADVLCPSEVELRQSMNDLDTPLNELAAEFIRMTNTRWLVVTRGHDGLVVFSKNENPIKLPALTYDPVDVLGSGDALLASLSMSLIGDAGIVESAYIGSIAAAIAGSEMGNSAVGLQAVLSRGQLIGAQFAHVLSQTHPVES
jgi:rfaE bifunctional protein kinase chain/domain/rfaE bifunctional protein nucleotidyltransferase chain/domain